MEPWEHHCLVQQLCDTGFTILNSALNATVHQAWSAPCCVSFRGLHSHKCLLPSLKPFSATLLLIRVLCVLNICLHASDAPNSPFGTDLIIVALLMFTNVFHFPLFQELLLFRVA